MSLDKQIRDLIDNAPQDGTTPALIEAIAPVLKTFAARLRHTQYYVEQSLEKGWVINILEHSSEPGVQKKIIYAFPTLQDLSLNSASHRDPQMIALPVPITHILFQMAAVEDLHSVVFFETPGNAEIGTEVQRSELQAAIQTYLHNQPIVPTLPPDIA